MDLADNIEGCQLTEDSTEAYKLAEKQTRHFYRCVTRMLQTKSPKL